MPKRRNKPGTLSIVNKIFILCEGKKDKSEYSYYAALIKDLDLPKHRVTVELIDTKKNTGRELVKEAISKKLNTDIAWVAYDSDGYTKHPETFLLASQKGIKIAFSAICFEYWILLHFTYTSRNFESCESLLRHLKSTHGIECAKSSTNLYNETKDYIETAIGNGKKLVIQQRQAYPDKAPAYEMNPYTNIYELIEELRNYQEKN